MKLDLTRSQVVFVFVLLLCGVSSSVAQEAEWTWEDGEGNVRTRAELDEILEITDFGPE